MARLTPDAWTDAAMRRLGDGGVDAIKVELLAKDLGVSKGSFYWHFADRPALLQSVLERWQQTATEQIIAALESEAAPPRRRLRKLMDQVFHTPGEVDRFEAGVRAWAGTDPDVSAVVRDVDRRRVEYVEGLLLAAGIPGPEAKRRADLLYRTLVGEFVMRAHGAKGLSKRAVDSLHALLLSSRATDEAEPPPLEPEP